MAGCFAGAYHTGITAQRSASDPSQNVYFELDAPDGTQGLGIWTTHILLLIGEPLKTSDIRALYPGQSAPA